MNLYNPYPYALVDNAGAIAAGAKAYFYKAFDTSTAITVYQDPGLTVPHTWPVIAGSNGVLPPIYMPYGDFRVRITTDDGITVWTAEGIKNPDPTPVTSGGGGGTSDVVGFKTGDICLRFESGQMDGWVRANGRTIGSADSGATERADKDAKALFLKYWDNELLPLSSARGATAEADWAANKTLQLPDARGKAFFGADTMGNSAANVLQVSTTATATNTSNTITVASASGLALFMWCKLDNELAGYITAISGTTITLSQNYTGTTGSKSARFSPIGDAEQIAQTGGQIINTLSAAQMPYHEHTLYDPGHTHTVSSYGTGSGEAGQWFTGGEHAVSRTTASALTGITLSGAGGGQSFYILSPGIVGTVYIKL